MAVEDATGLASLRSPGTVRSGLVLAFAARIVHLASALLVARAVVREHGDGAWGLVALAFGLLEIALAVDLSAQDVTAYEVATASTRAELEARLRQVALLATAPALLGFLVLLGIGAAAPWLLGTSDALYPTLFALLAAAAASYPFFVSGNVHAGTLEGLGWIFELNVSVVAVAVFDLAVVWACVALDTSLVTLQWARASRAVFRQAVLLLLLRLRGLPVAVPGRPDRSALARVLRYASTYTASRGLGFSFYRAPVVVAQYVAPMAAVGALDLADQVANPLYRVSHVLYETTFNRYARVFREGAPPELAAAGRSEFVAITLALTFGLAPIYVTLSQVAPWAFELWLGVPVPEALAVLPYLAFAWMVNASGSQATCVLLASNRHRPPLLAHAASLALTVFLGVVLGLRSGVVGVAEAVAVGNVALVAGLCWLACHASGARFGPLAAWGGGTWLVSGLLVWAAVHLPVERGWREAAVSAFALGLGAAAAWASGVLPRVRAALAARRSVEA